MGVNGDGGKTSTNDNPVELSPSELVDDSTPRDRDDIYIGRVLNGRVRIIRSIARGGMGKVYFGEQIALGRACAIKILDPRLLSESDGFTRRFLLEASTAAKLTHPNAVTIYDYGQVDDGTCYIAMEYLEGRTLAAELKETPRLPIARVVSIARQVCRALREAHELGVVHRDMKPGNVFLVRNENVEEGDFVKVLDFGLVKDSHQTDDGNLTQVGQIMGSPKYMAPEQVQGRDVDPRTDIYSVGVMLFTMLTGHSPFEKHTPMATMLAHVSEPVPPFSAVAPDLALPEGTEAFVRKCLAKNPDERFRSMEDLLLALKVFENPNALLGVTRSGVYATTNDAAKAPSIPPPARAFKRAMVGVAVASIALGAILVRSTSETKTEAPAAAASPPPVVAVVTPPAAPAKPPPRFEPRVLRIETEPPGAKVKEDGNVLCAATPCDVTFSGDAADPTLEHLLTFAKADYKLESKIIRVSGAPLTVHLSKARR